MGSTQPPTNNSNTLTPEQVQKMEQDIKAKHRALLIQTQEVAVKFLTLDKEKKQVAYPEMYIFCSSVLAVNLFRLLDDAQDLFTVFLSSFRNRMIVGADDDPNNVLAQQLIQAHVVAPQDATLDAAAKKKLFRYFTFYDISTEQVGKSWANPDEWMPDFDLTPEFFFNFVSEYAVQLLRLNVVGEEKFISHYELFPGYTMLAECLIYRCFDKKQKLILFTSVSSTNQELKKLTKLWIATTFSMLNNRSFINVLLHLLVPRTNAHDVSECYRCLDTLDAWFQELKLIDEHFTPDSANLLLKALDILFASDHFQILIRTLIFVYNILDLFASSAGKLRMRLVYDFLLKEWFFKLFLHWNDDTRTCFHRILVYKV